MVHILHVCSQYDYQRDLLSRVFCQALVTLVANLLTA